MYLEHYLRWCRPGLLRPEDRPVRALGLTNRGQPMGYFAVRARLQHHAQALGIDKHLTPHWLRHACATRLLERQAELRHIQELQGHTSVATPQVHTHVSVGQLKATLQRLPPTERATLEAENTDG